MDHIMDNEQENLIIVEEEDEDVVLKGSVLHEHLINCGLGYDLEIANNMETEFVPPTTSNDDKDSCQKSAQNVKIRNLTKSKETKYKQTVARIFLESKLLVAEDEEFIQNFIFSTKDHDKVNKLKDRKDLERLILFGAIPAAVTASAASLTYFWDPKPFKVISITTAVGLIGLLTVRKYFQETHVDSFKKLSQSLETLAKLKEVVDKVN